MNLGFCFPSWHLRLGLKEVGAGGAPGEPPAHSQGLSASALLSPQALYCSCFVPVYCGFIPPTYRGVVSAPGAEGGVGSGVPQGPCDPHLRKQRGGLQTQQEGLELESFSFLNSDVGGFLGL